MNLWKEATVKFRSALEREQELNRQFIIALERSNEEHNRMVDRLKELEGR